MAGHLVKFKHNQLPWRSPLTNQADDTIARTAQVRDTVYMFYLFLSSIQLDNGCTSYTVQKWYNYANTTSNISSQNAFPQCISTLFGQISMI